MAVREIFDEQTDIDLVMADAAQFSSSRSSSLSRDTKVGSSFYTRKGKRAFDLIFALFLLPFLIVPIFAAALLIKRDGGSAFFVHKRVGKCGKEFGCIKLRTMRTDAQQFLQDYLAENDQARIEWNSTYKLKNDPRITKLGKFLRKTSLDELPQLFNVIRGDMSFVGPRPVPAKELLAYGKAKYAYQAGRPGITGEWQIGGRNDITYDERVAMDVSYRKSENFVSDLTIIVKTPLKILKPTGI